MVHGQDVAWSLVEQRRRPSRPSLMLAQKHQRTFVCTRFGQGAAGRRGRLPNFFTGSLLQTPLEGGCGEWPRTRFVTSSKPVAVGLSNSCTLVRYTNGSYGLIGNVRFCGVSRQAAEPIRHAAIFKFCILSLTSLYYLNEYACAGVGFTSSLSSHVWAALVANCQHGPLQQDRIRCMSRSRDRYGP